MTLWFCSELHSVTHLLGSSVRAAIEKTSHSAPRTVGQLSSIYNPDWFPSWLSRPVTGLTLLEGGNVHRGVFLAYWVLKKKSRIT